MLEGILSKSAIRGLVSTFFQGAKIFHFSLLQSVSSKEQDILSLLISLCKASLIFTALSKKAFKFCVSLV